MSKLFQTFFEEYLSPNSDSFKELHKHYGLYHQMIMNIQIRTLPIHLNLFKKPGTGPSRLLFSMPSKILLTYLLLCFMPKLPANKGYFFRKSILSQFMKKKKIIISLSFHRNASSYRNTVGKFD